MWHGSRGNRQFSSRNSVFAGLKDVRDVLTINADGLYELTDPKIQSKIKQFFVTRDDDGVELLSGQ